MANLFERAVERCATLALALLLWLAGLLGGCALFDDDGPGAVVSVDQFADAQVSPQPPVAWTPSQKNAPIITAPRPTNAQAGDAAGDNGEADRPLGQLPPATMETSPKTGNPDALTMDAMVGQVNGQAIYAGRVLLPLDEQFKRLGEALPKPVFVREARKAIAARLDEIVFNKLMLGEAERDLSDQERQGLAYRMKQRREELVRQWGGGSEVVADTQLQESRGRSLDESLEQYRQEMVVQRYLGQKLLPKINITRKDIERYYYDHIAEFRPQPGRTIRLMRTDKLAHAEQMDKRLAAGEGFAKVAGSELNAYRQNEAGLFAKDMVGDQVFGIDELNQAMLKLKSDECSPRLHIGEAYYWIYVEKSATGQARTLTEAQHEIEDLLRRQRFQALTQRYRDQVFKRGSFNPLSDMVDSLVNIAVCRYCKQS